MTLGLIVTLGIASVMVIVIVLIVNYDCESNTIRYLISLTITILILAMIWGFAAWLSINTESGRRAYKTQQSNFNGGITREVKVFDIEGDMIAEYRGKFDVQYDHDRILFDDENGNRHIIYYPTGTIIIDEVNE